MKIEKPKVPKGLCYVIKSSQLEEIFEELGVTIDISVKYYFSKEGAQGIRVFECLYWLPNKNVPYERLYINVGTVTFTQKDKIDTLLKEFFPKFKEWVLFMASLSENSTFLKQNNYIQANFTNDSLTVKSSP
ncbi:hypothetical protein [Pedobacter frigoris]|uniref:hypothetical protein n=1 Tax=Pedobacter frigoris TaxID=2571272 RepID=UPI00292F65DA|nr:hypothetical protein [Pedobacter frigoris]